MKIIELLNRIANGEDIPKKIKYRDEIWEYQSTIMGKCYQYYNSFWNDWRRLEDKILLEECLNEEVEIIEEKKEIEEIIINNDKLKFPNGGGQWTARNMDKAFAIKINELIDEVNKLKELNMKQVKEIIGDDNK